MRSEYSGWVPENSECYTIVLLTIVILRNNKFRYWNST